MPQISRDLTDAQWAILDAIIPEPLRRRDGRGRPWRDRRTVLNGISRSKIGHLHAWRLLDLLRRETSWQQFKAGFGQLRPRLEAWYGDAGAKYASYNRGMTPLPWTDALLSLRAKVSEATSATFNGVLLNLYRNERDSVAAHADNEPEFGVDPVIASVSLGATRRFVLRYSSTGKTRTINLAHGSLLVMAGAMQTQYTHAIPKETSPRTERINLTFRRILDRPSG